MTAIYFEELMSELGCAAQGRAAFGACGAYPFSAHMDDEGPRNVFTLRFAVAGGAQAPAARLAGQRRGHARWRCEGAGGSVLVAYVRPPSDFYAKSDIHSAMAAARAALGGEGLLPHDACPLCGLAGCDTYALLDGEYRPAHAACVDSRLGLPEEDAPYPAKTRGHMATGAPGALAGALLGCLPALAQALNTLGISWVLYAFIPLFAALLYRLFRGRAHLAAAAVCVLAASLVAALALEQVWYWLRLRVQDGASYPFYLTVPHYFASHSLSRMLSEMWQSLLFIVFGFIPAGVLLRRYCAQGSYTPPPRRGARFVRATARPIPPAEEPLKYNVCITHSASRVNPPQHKE